MAALKNLVPDFREYLSTLTREQMLALLNNLVGDEDGLSAQGMYSILHAAKVEGYCFGNEPVLPNQLLTPKE